MQIKCVTGVFVLSRHASLPSVQMRNVLLYVVAILNVFFATSLSAQDNVSLLSVDSAGRRYSVTYVAPDTSAYATTASIDTVFCAAIVQTVTKRVGIVRPMERIDMRTYSVNLDVPDSMTYIHIEICVPTDRLPDGIAAYAFADDSLPLPGAVPSNWSSERSLAYHKTTYPWYVYAYVQYPRPNAAALDSTIVEVIALAERSFQKYFTLSILYGMQEKRDEEIASLDSAVSIILSEGRPDILLFNEQVWNTYYYPKIVDGKRVSTRERFTHMTDVVRAYPSSELARLWIERIGSPSDIDTASFARIVEAWSTSNDVDVLRAIAESYSYDHSPLNRLDVALRYARAAERSAVTQAGFRSGENIFGSMGRLDNIRAKIISILAQQGKYAEAAEVGRTALMNASSTDGQQDIAQAYAGAVRAAGDVEKAESILRIDLPTVQNFTYTTLSGITSSLTAHAGRVIVLDFWFLGCAGCAVEHKSLNEFALRMRNDTSVVILTVALNDARTLSEHMKRASYAYDIVPNGESICDALGITGFPTHIVIDRFGKTTLWELGGYPDSGERLESHIRTLLR